MPRRLAWVPVVLPVTVLAEVLTFVLVARAVGAGWAVLAVVAASLAGLLLLRREGMRAWRRFRAAAERGEPPGGQLSDGVVGLAGALLLAVPGFVTAVLGLLLLLPPGRLLARRQLAAGAARRMSAAAAGDLFGPRRVRVRRGAPTTDGPVPDGPPAAGQPGPAIEGEIVQAPRPPG